MRWIFSSNHSEKITADKLKRIEDYADKNIDEMFAIRKDLLEGKRPANISNKMMRFYENTKKNFAKDKNTIEGYVEDSIKALLKKRQRNRLFKTKLWSSLGGFVVLGSCIELGDRFVEKYIMKKYVGPYIDNIDFGNNQYNANWKNFLKD